MIPADNQPLQTFRQRHHDLPLHLVQLIIPYIQLHQTAQIQESLIRDHGQPVPGQTQRLHLALVGEGPFEDDRQLVAVQPERMKTAQVEELIHRDELHAVIAQVEMREIRQKMVDLGVDATEETGSALQNAKFLK